MFQHRIGHFVLALTALLALGNGLLVGAINVSAAPSVAGVAHSPAQIAPPALAANPALKREVFGFALGSSLSDPTIGYSTWNFSLLTTVAYFGLHVQDDGTFAADSSRTVWDSGQIGALVSSAHAHGARVILTIVLQDFGAGNPHMCSGLSHQSTTVANTVAEVKAKGVDGVNVDYEGLNNSCGTSDSSWARHTMTGFVAALRSALPAGSYLSVDTYAGSASDPIGFYDVAAMAPSVDSFFVMAYDLEYANYRRSPLGCSSFCLSPTAPLNGYYYNDTSTAAQYVATVPASKVILGVPYYGRKACVAGATQNQYPTGALTADTYLDASSEGTDPAVQAGSYSAHRDPYDPAGQERWDTWFNTPMGCTRELSCDDPVALGLKYDLTDGTACGHELPHVVRQDVAWRGCGQHPPAQLRRLRELRLRHRERQGGHALDRKRGAGDVRDHAAGNHRRAGARDSQLWPCRAGVAEGAVQPVLQRAVDGSAGPGGYDELLQLVRQGISRNGERQHSPAQSRRGERQRHRQPAGGEPAVGHRRCGRRGLRHVPTRHHRRARDGDLDPAGDRVAACAVQQHLQRGVESNGGGDGQLLQLVRQGLGGDGGGQHPPAQSGRRRGERDGQPARRQSANG